MNRNIAPSLRAASDQTSLLRVAYKGRFLIAIGAIIGLGLGYLNYVRSDLEYSSTAQLLVKSKTTAPIPVDGTTALRETTDITTHAAVLQSPALIDRAIRDYDLASIPRAAFQNLKITPRSGSDAILDVSFESNSDVGSAKVVNGLINAFQDFYGEMDQNMGQKMLELVREANIVLADQLRQKQMAYDRFRENSPLIDRDGNSLNLHQERMMGIEAERAALELQVNALDVEIQSIDKAFATGMDVNAIRIMAEQISGKRNTRQHEVGSQPGISNSALHSQLLPLLIEFQSLEERYGADHPDVLGMKKQIELLKGMDPMVAESKGVSFDDFTRSDLKAHLLARRAIRDAKAKELASLHTMFESEQNEARALIGSQVRDSELRSDLQRTQKLFDSVVSRLDEVNLTKDHGGYNIQVLAYAEPGHIVSLSLAEQLLRGCIFGVLGGFGLSYLLVQRDTRFVDIRDVSNALEIPIMGAISNFDEQIVNCEGQDDDVAASIQSFHRPKSSIAEGYRGIRTSLYFSMDDRRRVVQVTSPLPGEGKSTLTANLAVSMAASGRRVLVIDGDMRRPRQHQLLGPSMDFQEKGLSGLLNGEMTLEESIFKTSIPNLSLLPSGAIPENPGELLVSKKLDEVIKTASENYDFVLVDSPPMLAVSDSSSIATRVEGVLVTFNLEKTPRQAVTRSRELLQKVDADIVGVVVNQVEVKKEGKFGRMYGYGNYSNYGDAYYGYSDYHYDARHSDGRDKPKPKPKSVDKGRSNRNDQIGV